MQITLAHYLTLSALLFAIGVYGALTRRNAIAVLMSIELMLNAVNINMVSLSKYVTPKLLTGQVFAGFVITLAAAEACVGFALVISIYRSTDKISVDEINILKW